MHVVTVVVIGKQEMHYYCYKHQREGMKGLKKQQQTPVEEEEEGEKGRESTGPLLVMRAAYFSNFNYVSMMKYLPK